ncbi:hypothetical protein L9F63_022427 [Diploptera punctata]|uniref:DUF4797 domain-containing protein n=1 Tax=Diploptera punctata TaxID=6984 RepID=A0AAD7ZMQ5_DIPPU|nr:hypothetical protein L9F63_022427 [Diploptera punctata]
MDEEGCNGNGTTMLLVTLNPSSSRGSPRSVSPMTPSPTRDLRGLSLFRAISRRLGRQRRHHVDDEDDDDDDVTSQSSSDSDDRSSGSAGGRVSRSKKCSGKKKQGFLHRSTSCIGSDSGLLHMHGSHCAGSSGGSSSGSDTGSGHNGASSSSSSLHQGSSLRRVFQSLTRNSRSHSASCATTSTTNSNTDSKRRVSDGTANSGKKKNKSILRAPVTYTYVRGLSGLPTQRVPRGYPCVYFPANVCCGSPRFSTQHPSGLNR